jgi:GT2 family glycosyltransferase
MSLSVLTIVRNRPLHLAQLVEGLRRSIEKPDELIVIDMGSEPAVAMPDAAFPVHILELHRARLPLAAARNMAARAACGDTLLFLDVDCIPMRDLVGEMRCAVQQHDSLLCAEALYLGPEDARCGWNEEELRQIARSHPVRPFPSRGIREETNPGLFWSLIFSIGRARFAELGGFDEAFDGYGAEDTDFGFRAKHAGLPLMFMGGTGAFHQHHAIFEPPLQHLEDIVRNAQLFYDRWRTWPMEGWLTAFQRLGLIEWSPTALALRRLASDTELEHARLQ